MTERDGGEPATAPTIPPQVWQLDAASLSDANKALRVLPRELRPYTRGIRMVGRTVTVTASDDLMPVLAGLERCGVGDILVVDAGTTEHAVLGELFATEAIRRQMAGVVVYGLCRDTATLARATAPHIRARNDPQGGRSSRAAHDSAAGTPRRRRGSPRRDHDRRR